MEFPQMDFIDQEHFDGYMDGHDVANPAPSGNRTKAYIHSFKIARHEALGKGALYPAWLARMKSEQIREQMEKGLAI